MVHEGSEANQSSNQTALEALALEGITMSHKELLCRAQENRPVSSTETTERGWDPSPITKKSWEMTVAKDVKELESRGSERGATALRILLGVVAIWSAIQVGFLAFAFASSPPSPLAELMHTRHEAVYLASFGFHAFTLLVFGVGAYRSNRTWRRIWHEGQEGVLQEDGSIQVDDGSSFPVTAYVVLTLVLIGIFIGSAMAPRYQVFLDLSSESVVRRDTHLLPPGMNELRIPFRNIIEIDGFFVRHEHSEDDQIMIRYHYRLDIVEDGRRTEIGWGSHQKKKQEIDQGMFSLALAIADVSGAKLDLR